MADSIPVRTPCDWSARRVLISRRAWLYGTLLAGTGAARCAWSASGKDEPLTAAEQAEIAKIEAIAKKVGIGPFGHGQTEHFIGLGDAPAAFRQRALDVAESFSKAFLTYFRSHGFKVELPAGRMAVITLKNADSYRALVGEQTGLAVGGHYDIETNRLVMFDMRGQRAALAIPAEQVNTFALVHETAHLLSYNTGILSPHADNPVSISEGIATLAEPWRPKAKSKIGDNNGRRVAALWDEEGNAKTWVPVAELLNNDHLFDDADTEQVAYAESWLLIHYLMRKEATRTKLREYIDRLANEAHKTGGRLKAAEAHLGSLEALDREIRKHAREFSRP